MPQKDAVVKEAIKDVIGTSRLGRKKIIVNVQKNILTWEQLRFDVYEKKVFHFKKNEEKTH